MHLQSRAGLGHRKGPAAGEVQQRQQLVAGEGQAERFEYLFDPRHEDLLGPHQRGHHGHAVRDLTPAVVGPLAVRFGDRVER